MKPLSEIDDVYGSMYHKMSIRERISYCGLLINTANSDKKKKNAYPDSKERIDELLMAAKKELQLLRDTDQKI